MLPRKQTKEEPPRAASGAPARPAVLEAVGISKTYGATHANSDLSFTIEPGDILGLVGANGAGKSTLMRILCGVTRPDTGRLAFHGQPVELAAYSPHVAQAEGVRIVWQELSLAPNLTVAENFYVEQPGRAGRSPFWRRTYQRLARDSIETIFPGARISPARLVADLTIAERQMVEIARAAADPTLKLLILDEPTSSLGAERSADLRRFVRRRAEAGTAIVFISHKLAEVLDVSTRVMAMRNGRIVWTRPAAATHLGDLVTAMGGSVLATEVRERTADEPASAAPVRVRLAGEVAARVGRPVELRAGEIVGLAGLEGGGQKETLRALFEPGRGGEAERNGRVSFVSGDRQREGVFPLWSVLENIAIGRVAEMNPFRLVRETEERELARGLAGRLALDEARLGSGILDLSGGNQQKAIVARALSNDAEIVLLDDPTRGVDIAAKRDFYRLVRSMADSGRLVVWHSTEDLEFLECDRVLVFSGGRIARELAGAEIEEEAIVAASFDHGSSETMPVGERRDMAGVLLRAVPFVTLLLVFAIMASLNPMVASAFGLELLLGPAVPLVLVALAQMFIVAGSEIDLGVGAFVGLVNVVSATLLVSSPLLGSGALLAGILGYGLIGILIQAREIPAIVVTLGTSFIFFGIGQTLQPSPGGSSPEWLASLFTFAIPGVPTPLFLILLAGLAAFLIDRSPAGTILRAFGAAPLALTRAGWSPLRYAVLRYVIASLFALAAGLFLTGTNGASDINAGSSYTLLSIAGVVIGGCQLMGGIISPLGTVAGAVTLSLIGALLASVGVSTDYNAAVQGGLLIAILSLQTLATWRRRHA